MSTLEYLEGYLGKKIENEGGRKEVKEEIENMNSDERINLVEALEVTDEATRVINQDLEKVVVAAKAYKSLHEEERKILDEYGIKEDLESTVENYGLNLNEPMEEQVKYESEEEFYERKEEEIDELNGADNYKEGDSIIGDTVIKNTEEGKEEIDKQDYLRERKMILKDQ